MNRIRRSLALLLVCGVVPAALAQGYPAKPVRMVVPYIAGGTPDFLARTLGQKVGSALGQQVIVDNRPGAGGNIGTEIVARSAADGYTIVMGAVSPFAINIALYGLQRMKFDPQKDFVPVTLVSKAPLILLVHPSLPARSVQDIIALARKNPGKLSYGSAGNGTSNHLVGEMFKEVARVDIRHIPFRGTAIGVVAAISGEIETIMGQIPSTITHIRSGRLRPLAISGERRSPALPEVPTFLENGLKGLEVTSWYVVAAPAGTPQAVIARLHQEYTKALAAPDVLKRIEGEGAIPSPSTPEEAAAFINAEIPRWARAVRVSGAKLD